MKRSTKETAKHTPTPWVAEDYNGKTDTIMSATVNGVRLLICRTWSNDAAFIVRAVNSHEKLVTALRKLLEFSDARGMNMQRSVEESSLADDVSDLLAQAEGK